MNARKFSAVLLALIMLLVLPTGCSKEEGIDSADSEKPLFAYSNGLTKDGFIKGLNVAKYVTLPKYIGVPSTAALFEADRAIVDEQINMVLGDYAEYFTVTDRAVQDGDTVNIDYVGSVDGVEFDGGSTGGAGTDVTIGVTPYIDDFLEQLIGHMPGENFDIEVTFPDPYMNNPDLAGKDAVFNITINHITEAVMPPELTDEMAGEYGFNSAEELISDIEDWAIRTARSEYVDELLADTSCENVPKQVFDYVAGCQIAYFEMYSTYYDMDLEAFLQSFYGYGTKEEFIEDNRASLNQIAVQIMGRLAIAEKEGLKVTMSDVEELGYGEVAETYGEPYACHYVLTEVIVPNFIIENAQPYEGFATK